MREHLRDCLQRQSFKARSFFPRREDRAFSKKKQLTPEDPASYDIMCTCRLPKTPASLKFEKESLPPLKCKHSTCAVKKFHRTCVDLQEREESTWICPFCVKL